MAENKSMKVKFAPGVLEQLEASMSAEELQEFLNEIHQMAESGEIVDKSQKVDMQQLKTEDPELFEILSKQLDGVYESDEDDEPTVH